jgi:hypothetical protein
LSTLTKRKSFAAQLRGFFLFTATFAYRKCLYRTLGESQSPSSAPAGPGIHQIAELAYVIDPNTDVERNITENRAAIPLFTFIFHPVAPR